MNGFNSTTDSSNVMVVDDVKKKFEKDEKFVGGYLLNYMPNPLFDLFLTFKSVRKFGK